MSANIDVSHPIVREELINWGKWIIRETGADGFRFDAVRHIDEKFLAEFVRAVREDQDNVRYILKMRSIARRAKRGLTLFLYCSCSQPDLFVSRALFSSCPTAVSSD